MISYRQLFKICELIGYRYQESIKTTIIGDDQDDMEDYCFRTDKYGFRNSEATAIDTNTIGDLFVGCSFVAGDGVGNDSRFSSIVNKKYGNAYNCGLSGSCYAQMTLISEEINKQNVHTQRFWFMPYIGALRRSLLNSRSSNFFNGKVSWSKPYFSIQKGKIILMRPEKIKPSIHFNLADSNSLHTQSGQRKKVNMIDQLCLDFSNEIYASIMNYVLSTLKNIYIDSQKVFAPIPNIDLLAAQPEKRNYIVSFYKESAEAAGFPYLDLTPHMPNYDSLFFKRDGHLNKHGHKKISEILAYNS